MSRATVVPVVIGLFVALSGCGGGLELTPAHPLGTLADITAMLPADVFERSQRTFTEAECFGPERQEKYGELTVHVFEEHPGSSMGVRHWVLVGVDAAGQVQAIGAKFASQSAKFTTSGTRSQAFMASLWQELQGGEAAFTKANRPGIDMDEYFYANLAKGAIKGYWEKIPNSRNGSDTRSIWDMALVWRE